MISRLTTLHTLLLLLSQLTTLYPTLRPANLDRPLTCHTWGCSWLAYMWHNKGRGRHNSYWHNTRVCLHRGIAVAVLDTKQTNGKGYGTRTPETKKTALPSVRKLASVYIQKHNALTQTMTNPKVLACHSLHSHILFVYHSCTI